MYISPINLRYKVNPASENFAQTASDKMREIRDTIKKKKKRFRSVHPDCM